MNNRMQYDNVRDRLLLVCDFDNFHSSYLTSYANGVTRKRTLARLPLPCETSDRSSVWLVPPALGVYGSAIDDQRQLFYLLSKPGDEYQVATLQLSPVNLVKNVTLT